MTAPTRATLDAERPPPAWVVCLGGLREVESGRVMCPITAAPADVDGCLQCRHLADLSDERSPSRSCSYEG